MKFVPRRQADRLTEFLRTFSTVFVFGPRQCGKTTLVRRLHPDWLHLDLERPADYGALSADIEGFLEANPQRVSFDEAQRLPDLFPALRHAIDRSRRKGRFILLGSATPPLLRAVSETLAGRIALLELTPFSAAELRLVGREGDRWFWGGFPPVHALRGSRARSAWLDSYVSTYLERDLPALGLRLPAQRLRILWTMLTHVHGNVLNVSDLARSLTVSPHTVSDHLDVLESTFMIRRLPPFFANVQKRLTKAPKLYVRDTGLLHFLAGLRTPRELLTWPRRGQSFEGMVVEEILALAAERIVRPEAAFWRTHAGAEVDLIVRDGKRLTPIEIKLSANVDHRAVAGLRQCMRDLGIKRGWVVANTSERRSIARDVELVPWREIVERREDFGFGGRR